MIWLAALLGTAGAQDEPWMKTHFVIAASEKAYPEAIRKAAALSAASGIRLDTRGVGFDPAHQDAFGGLTLSPETCRDAAFEYPCYVSRGRYEGDATYISVERTDAFRGLTPDLYVVIVAVGDKAYATAALDKVKPHVKDAYVKQGEVYVGCMH